jgi:hypothetical protein
VELRFLIRGEIVVFDRLGAILDGEVFAARKLAEEALDKRLLGRFEGKDKKSELWRAFSLRLDVETRKVLSAIDLFAQPPRVNASPSGSSLSGVKILRQALEADLTAIPVNRKIEKRAKATVEKCPPDQVVCKEGPP